VREWVAGQANFETLDVEYREVINDPGGQATRVNQFLGGRLNEARMAATVEPALYRQRSGSPEDESDSKSRE
jgi:hypothetical protein